MFSSDSEKDGMTSMEKGFYVYGPFDLSLNENRMTKLVSVQICQHQSSLLKQISVILSSKGNRLVNFSSDIIS